MRKFLFMGLLGIVALLILACGEAATPVPATVAPTEPPTATTAPTQTMVATEAPSPMTGDYSPELLAIAAERTNGPGAFFVGDINDLVGPAPTPEEGDAEGNVPLDALEKHLYVYESDYYRTVIDREPPFCQMEGDSAGPGHRGRARQRARRPVGDNNDLVAPPRRRKTDSHPQNALRKSPVRLRVHTTGASSTAQGSPIQQK